MLLKNLIVLDLTGECLNRVCADSDTLVCFYIQSMILRILRCEYQYVLAVPKVKLAWWEMVHFRIFTIHYVYMTNHAASKQCRKVGLLWSNITSQYTSIHEWVGLKKESTNKSTDFPLSAKGASYGITLIKCLKIVWKCSNLFLPTTASSTVCAYACLCIVLSHLPLKSRLALGRSNW